MICYVCETKIDNGQQPGCYNPVYTIYNCPKCKEEMIVHEDIKKGDQAFQHQRYRIYCDNKNNRSKIQRLVMDIESDTSITYGWYTILELPSIPQNLNEETVEQKLKTILLFS